MRTKFIFLLQIATFCVFAGRAYQHLFWDAPFRALFWSEDWMSGIVSTVFGMEWSEYVRSPQTDLTIQRIIIAQGIFYALCATVTAFVRRLPRIFHILLLAGAICLTFLAFLYTKEKWYHFGQFLEYALQAGSPLLLWYTLGREHLPDRKFILIVKVLIAVTFVCHGLYALNYYPRPGNFTQMTISILGIGESEAVRFLNFAGIMDMIIAVGVFLPRRVALPLLGYAALWGFCTSLARVWADFYLDYWAESLHQHAWQTVCRVPHFMIPVAAIWYTMNRKKQEAETSD